MSSRCSLLTLLVGLLAIGIGIYHRSETWVPTVDRLLSTHVTEFEYYGVDECQRYTIPDPIEVSIDVVPHAPVAEEPTIETLLMEPSPSDWEPSVDIRTDSGDSATERIDGPKSLMETLKPCAIYQLLMTPETVATPLPNTTQCYRKDFETSLGIEICYVRPMSYFRVTKIYGYLWQNTTYITSHRTDLCLDASCVDASPTDDRNETIYVNSRDPGRYSRDPTPPTP